MARATQAAKVGLFVALTGAAAYGIYHFVSPEVAGGKTYTVHAYIKDATGLAQRSRVTIAGIPWARSTRSSSRAGRRAST
jgi:ABC-type transporter Mla subunit MlaD